MQFPLPPPPSPNFQFQFVIYVIFLLPSPRLPAAIFASYIHVSSSLFALHYMFFSCCFALFFICLIFPFHFLGHVAFDFSKCFLLLYFFFHVLISLKFCLFSIYIFVFLIGLLALLTSIILWARGKRRAA